VPCCEWLMSLHNDDRPAALLSAML